LLLPLGQTSSNYQEDPAQSYRKSIESTEVQIQHLERVNKKSSTHNLCMSHRDRVESSLSEQLSATTGSNKPCMPLARHSQRPFHRDHVENSLSEQLSAKVEQRLERVPSSREFWREPMPHTSSSLKSRSCENRTERLGACTRSLCSERARVRAGERWRTWLPAIGERA